MGLMPNDLVKPSDGPVRGIPIEAVAVPLFPASEVKSPVVRSNGPSPNKVIPTLAEHVELAASDPPLKATVLPPSATTKVPPQSLIA
jgi:hypothetical protein